MSDKEQVNLGKFEGEPYSRFEAFRYSLRRHLWVPLLVWIGLVIIPLIPLFMASYLPIGENGIHGVQIGLDNKAMIHGSELKCKEGRPTRECTLIINGSLLEISAPPLGERGTCRFTYEGETFVCQIASVTGEQTFSPFAPKNGIVITAEKVEQYILADQASWQNWRSRFLGVGKEDLFIVRLFSWTTISLILSFLIIPTFLKSSPTHPQQSENQTVFFLIKFGSFFIVLPIMCYLLIVALVAFQFVL